MALPLPKTAKKKSVSYKLPKDGAYLIKIKQAEDKIDDFENSKRKGNHYYNLRIEHENGRIRFERIDYLNKEGDTMPFGYNFLIAMREILFQADEVPQKLKDDLENKDDLDSDDIFRELIQNNVRFYAVFRNSKYEGQTYTGLNNFFDPFYTLDDDVKEDLEKRKLEVVELEKTEKSDDYDNPEVVEDDDEEDDDY